MMFNVPQFIEIEDKIVGPLTAKQLGWIISAGVLLLIFWGTLDTAGFFVAAVIVVVVFGSLAFYRPYNQPLIKFLMSSVYFVTRPKVYVWKRNYDNIRPVKKTAAKKDEGVTAKKVLQVDKIREISKMLDNK